MKKKRKIASKVKRKVPKNEPLKKNFMKEDSRRKVPKKDQSLKKTIKNKENIKVEDNSPKVKIIDTKPKNLEDIEKKLDLEKFSEFITPFRINSNINSDLEQIAPIRGLDEIVPLRFSNSKENDINYETNTSGDYSGSSEYLSSEDRKYLDADSGGRINRVDRDVSNDPIFRNPETSNNDNYSKVKDQEYKTGEIVGKKDNIRRKPWERE